MKLHRDASGRLSASLEVEASAFRGLVARVAERFELVPAGPATVGLDVAFREYAAGPHRVSLEWDIWMGFQVVALSPDSEALVERIAGFLDG